jgi:hypothetical protein
MTALLAAMTAASQRASGRGVSFLKNCGFLSSRACGSFLGMINPKCSILERGVLRAP